MQICPLDRRVLVVDDEKNVRLLLRRSLARLELGLEVQVADSGSQALDFFKNKPFDMVITDYQMPCMNGLELTRVLRQDHPNVKIILMTACFSTQIAEQVDELAVDGYLFKPFSTRHLREIVYDLLTSPEFSCPLTGGDGHNGRESKNPHS